MFETSGLMGNRVFLGTCDDINHSCFLPSLPFHSHDCLSTASLPPIDALRRAHGSRTPAAQRLAHLPVRALHPSRTTRTTPALRQLHASQRASNVPLRCHAKTPRAATQERTCAAVKAARPMSGRRHAGLPVIALPASLQTRMTRRRLRRRCSSALRVLTNDSIPCGMSHAPAPPPPCRSTLLASPATTAALASIPAAPTTTATATKPGYVRFGCSVLATAVTFIALNAGRARCLQGCAGDRHICASPA
ncbi:hypothetical protein GGX14DRAFT_642346 [Mycena pura]|uniref:Uncharacterized protein n=1 Tax=Mycena pura TaxID=153505 RepID=A0AAD6YQ70_9AGAR|nr:hypothetical protein GGX14DRAFT_642346 [Mycena pura]